MAGLPAELASLYRVRKGAFDIVDVPELGYLMIDGRGAPGGEAFAAATSMLYAVSYAVHFRLRRERGQAPAVMPLEAQWWVDDPGQLALLKAVTLGQASLADADRDRWRWRAVIVQPEGVGADLVAAAVGRVRAHTDPHALDRLRLERWEEGRCAQVLHIGPYADETPSIARLHDGIRSTGHRPPAERTAPRDLSQRPAPQPSGKAAHHPASPHRSRGSFGDYPRLIAERKCALLQPEHRRHGRGG
ncbi:hypothetical protein [Actinomadura chibensis]|uniref:GyrI-like small molecule binding domain-containing protein n=1 Tax=Actinomadura chibensis TaxID=392828 RepID=A0A5D0N704_9ACTN|nr:hypothetical protein [Actinomadura chibensis]TYB40139.1 hypothetical protein FXF69_39825 [Actinomadura chibensis]